jgi:hypothetical protein
MLVCTLIALILKQSLMTIFLQMLVQEPNKLNIEQGRFLGFQCHTNSAALDMQQNDTSPLVQGEKEKYTRPEYQTSTGYFKWPSISSSKDLVISCL